MARVIGLLLLAALAIALGIRLAPYIWYILSAAVVAGLVLAVVVDSFSSPEPRRPNSVAAHMTSGNSPKAAPQESEESQLARLVAEYEQALKDGVPVKAAQRILQAQRATLSYRSHARK